MSFDIEPEDIYKRILCYHSESESLFEVFSGAEFNHVERNGGVDDVTGIESFEKKVQRTPVSKHSNREKEVMLWTGKNYPSARIFRFDVGQAYAKFSVKGALQEYKRTSSITLAMKRLVTITYGTKGWPDLLILHLGIAIGIEIKVGKDRQSDEQKIMEKTFQNTGAAYILLTDKNSIEFQLAPTLDAIESTMGKLWQQKKQ